MNFSLRLALLIDIPAAVGLYILALPIVRVLFERGEFTDATAVATAGALVFFAFKIPFVSGARNLVPGFFALKDAKTPVYTSLVAVIVNAICAYLLMGSMAHRGLALALVISSAVNLALLLILFRRKVGPIGARRIVYSAGRSLFAAIFMGAALIVATRYVDIIPEWPIWQKVGVLMLLIAGAALIYVAIIRTISPEEFRALMHLIRRRKPPSVSSPETIVRSS
jgi:putative peptidoglycan lipid II flippase